MAAAVRLYLDENLTCKIAVQLQKKGIDVVTVYDLGLAGDTAINQLVRSTEMGRVLITADTDFLLLAAEGMEHSGIVFGVQEDNSIADWVKALEQVCFIYTLDNMKNHVEYLPLTGLTEAQN